MSKDILVNTDFDMTIQEIHNIAYFYHWGYEECWHIPCKERGVFNDKIVKQLRDENSSINGGK